MNILITGKELKENSVVIEEDSRYLKRYSQAMSSKLKDKVRELEDSLAERVRIEQRLLQSHEFTEQIINSIPDPIFVKDRQHRFFLVNDALCSFTGHTREELIGKSDHDFFPREEADEYCRKDELVFDSDRTNLNEENLTDADGNRYFIQTRKASFVAADGKEYLIGVIRNITELKQSEHALSQREQEYHTLVENIPDLIVRYDNELRRIYVNPAWEKASGLSAGEVLNVPASEITKVPKPVVKEYLAILRKVLECGTLQKIEFNWVNAHGVTLYLDYVLVPEYDHHGKVATVLAVGHDITARKQAEQELLEKRRRLSDMALELSMAEERERRSIATNLHDTIGQDLALTRINLGVFAKAALSDKETKLLDNTREIINQAIKKVRHLTHLISPPILESAGLETALKWLGIQMETDYGLQVLFKDDLSEKTVSKAIQTELYFAARELLINVAKHAKTRTARISVSRESDSIVIKIEDDGIGFDHCSIDANHAGERGFGLFNIQRRIIYLGGMFDIISAPGGGTCVTIGMPIKLMRDDG
jgi:PAS domain S-box-containing protein